MSEWRTNTKTGKKYKVIPLVTDEMADAAMKRAIAKIVGSSQLGKELFEIEPRRELLHDMCGFGPFAEVTQTGDGFFMGREKGDIGFNAFLGKPSEISIRRLNDEYERLSQASQIEAMQRCPAIYSLLYERNRPKPKDFVFPKTKEELEKYRLWTGEGEQ